MIDKDNGLELRAKVKQAARREIRRALIGGMAAADLERDLVTWTREVAREERRAVLLAALAAATTPQDQSMAARIRLELARADKARQRVARLKVQPERLTLALSLLRAAGWAPLDDGEPAHSSSWSPPVRLIRFDVDPLGAAELPTHGDEDE